MSELSIKKLIASGAWFQGAGSYYDEILEFRIRFLSFDVVEPEDIDARGPVEGLLRLLRVEVVNTSKHPIPAHRLRTILNVMDADGYTFHHATGNDQHKESGLHRLSGWSNNPPLSPKMKVIGAILYDLPDEETDYFLAVTDGSISEL